MPDFLMIMLIILGATYVLARISSVSASISEEKLQKIQEESRKKRIDILYGRHNGDE